MTYLITYYKDGEIVDIEESLEHPDEDYLRRRVDETGADFADICRQEDSF